MFSRSSKVGHHPRESCTCLDRHSFAATFSGGMGPPAHSRVEVVDDRSSSPLAGYTTCHRHLLFSTRRGRLDIQTFCVYRIHKVAIVFGIHPWSAQPRVPLICRRLFHTICCRRRDIRIVSRVSLSCGPPQRTSTGIYSVQVSGHCFECFVISVNTRRYMTYVCGGHESTCGRIRPDC